MMGAGIGIGLGKAVVAQPRPTVVQQKSFCAWDHEFSIIAALPKPASQSKGSDDAGPDNNQQSNGINKSRLRRQQLVMTQVKSLRGRPKSPPCPTYLYVVSVVYWPCPPPTYDIVPWPPPLHPTPQAVQSSPCPTPQAPQSPAAPRPPAYPPPYPPPAPAIPPIPRYPPAPPAPIPPPLE